MADRLAGKVALITGGGSGIGAATARRFVEEGAQVVVADLNVDSAEAIASELGGKTIGVAIDVVDRASIRTAIERTVAEFGGLDVLVCNAGVTIVGARGGGSIRSTASMAGQWAIPADAAYCASKAGLIMLTKCMAVDGAKQNIRANCICPGFTNTPMIDGYFNDQPDPAAARKFAENLHPLGRLGEPVDHANAFVYLASDEANWVTGTELNVDGGITCGIWGG